MTARRGRWGALIRPGAVTAATIGMVLTLVGSVGCGSHREAAPRLIDDSTPPPLPTALGDPGPGAVVSRVKVLRASELRGHERTCLRAFRPEFRMPPATAVVERTGAIGASLTWADAHKRVVLGCDRTARSGPSGRHWCARSVGRLFGGRLRDPRIDILCRTPRGDPVGFGWVEPAPEAHWIVSRIGPITEVERVAAGLPVRIATTKVDPATSTATFDVTEFDADGKGVNRQRLKAGVAG